jgi:hypothetical protein
MDLLTSFVRGLAIGLASQPAAYRQVQGFCHRVGFPIAEADGEAVTLHFNCPLFRVRRLLICAADDELVMFDAFSHCTLRYEQIPREVFGYCLERNNAMALGGWKMSADEKGVVQFGVRYCASVNGLSDVSFKFISEKLVTEAGTFDEKLHKAGLLRLN